MSNANEGEQGEGEQEPTSPLAPLAPFPNIQRSRATEFYGFAALTLTSVLFVLYHVWALAPDHLIEATGMTWYPSRHVLDSKYINKTMSDDHNREWSLLIPAYTVVIILLTYFTYWGLTLSATPSFEELRTITDSHAYLPRHGKENPYVRQVNPDALPELYDIPIGLVNRVLFDSSD